jgi:hypothetical protein
MKAAPFRMTVPLLRNPLRSEKQDLHSDEESRSVQDDSFGLWPNLTILIPIPRPAKISTTNP